ncbi:MAG: HAD family hydrolase [Deltaproteobacteria bacterium]|nr:HAD family hydrolase [Deltaproteobacteria bacterium]
MRLPDHLEALIFDLDGTLVDSEAEIVRSAIVAFERIGVCGVSPDTIHPHMGCPLEDLFVRFGGADQSAGRLARFVEAYRSSYEHDPGPGALFDGVVEMLASLGGYPKAVATTKPTWSAEKILASVGLDGVFDLVQGTDAMPPKPDPAVLLEAARRLGVPAGRCAMIGDTGRDIQAARAAGMYAVAVTWGGWSRARLEALRPDAIWTRPPR